MGTCISRAEYFVTFRGDFLQKVWIYFLIHKFDIFANFKQWKVAIKKKNQVIYEGFEDR